MQALHGILITAHIPCCICQIPDQGIDVIGCCSDTVLLACVDSSDKGVSVHAEKLLPDSCRIIKAWDVGIQIPQLKFVLRFAAAEHSGNLISLSIGLESEAAAVRPALPGSVPVPLIIFRAFFSGCRKSVEHCAQKGGESTLSPPVLPADHIQAIGKAAVKSVQSSEIFYMARDQFHCFSMFSWVVSGVFWVFLGFFWGFSGVLYVFPGLSVFSGFLCVFRISLRFPGFSTFL